MTDGTVRAKCFGVVDDYGNVRASMGLDRLGAVRLELRGLGGGSGVTAAATGRGAALGLLNSEGEAVVVLGVGHDGERSVLVRDDGGTERFNVSIRPDGGLICEIRDANG